MDSVEMDAANTLRGLRGDEDTKKPEKSKEPWMTCPVALWNQHVEDSKRLDWLEEQIKAATRGCTFRFGQDKTNGRWFVEVDNVRSSGGNMDLRAALDAAMEAYPNV